MEKEKLIKEFARLTEELETATKARDDYEYDYEMEKARVYFSAEVNGLSNQTMRDQQVTISLDEKGMFRKMSELRSDAKIAWYKWAAIKSLLENSRDGNLV